MAIRHYPMMPCTITDLDCGIGSDCNLVLTCNKKRFDVVLSRRPPPGFDEEHSIECQLLQKLDCAIESHENSEIDVIYEEISDLVASTCQPIFRELAPIIEDGPQKNDLHTFLNPDTFELQLVTLKGEAKVIERQTPTLPRMPRTQDLLNAKSTLPEFRSSEVEVLDELLGARILKVSINGRISCCKVITEYTHKSIAREFNLLRRILDANLPYIRVPKPVGYIKSDHDDVIAVLYDYIQADPNTPNLDLVRIDSVDKFRRAKWANQIRHTVAQLHDIGIIWGDGKPGNVLIDEDDGAWIIDFGGGWTKGWVKPELAETVEGDLQALKNIIEFLEV